MAAGDVTLFDQFLADLANGEHDMDADEFKLAFITDTVTPTTATAVPHFNGTGTTDLQTTSSQAVQSLLAEWSLPAQL